MSHFEQDLIFRCVRGELDEPEAGDVRRHLETCVDCQEVADRFTLVATLLAKESVAPLPRLAEESEDFDDEGPARFDSDVNAELFVSGVLDRIRRASGGVVSNDVSNDSVVNGAVVTDEVTESSIAKRIHKSRSTEPRRSTQVIAASRAGQLRHWVLPGIQFASAMLLFAFEALQRNDVDVDAALVQDIGNDWAAEDLAPTVSDPSRAFGISLE